MPNDSVYYACYCQLEHTSGDSCIQVDGNTIVIGAELTLTPQVHVTEKGKEVSRIILKRDDLPMGFLPDRVYKQVAKLLDEGWVCRAFTSLAVYDKNDKRYWSEAAIICYDKEYAETFDTFVDLTVDRMCKGEHPAVNLTPKEIEHVIEVKGQWADAEEVKLPRLSKGSAYFKTKRTMTENMAYAAAEGNKGCYVGLFAVVFIIIFSIVWFLFLR